MVPYDTYGMYQFERTKTLAEIRYADHQAAQPGLRYLIAVSWPHAAGASRAQAILGCGAPPAPPGMTGRLCWQQSR